MDRPLRLIPLKCRFVYCAETPDLVIVKDVGPWDIYRTITNDLEAFIANTKGHIDGRRVYIIDSMGEIDELIVDANGNGRFESIARFKEYHEDGDNLPMYPF